MRMPAGKIAKRQIQIVIRGLAGPAFAQAHGIVFFTKRGNFVQEFGNDESWYVIVYAVVGAAIPATQGAGAVMHCQ